MLVHMTGARAGDPPSAPSSALRTTGRLLWRTVTKAWDDSIISRSATTAFWQTLSLPPLLLGLLGCLGYVGGWFGPDTLDIIESKIIAGSREAFSPNVVDELIQPTVQDVLQRGRAEIVSVGFVLSLWAGSSAMATFVDSIVDAHGQQDSRNPVWQRIFALLLYVGFLLAAVLLLPLIALGPTLIGRALPEHWRDTGTQLIDYLYYPGVGLTLIMALTTLYKLALHRSLPWHRLLGGALVAGVFFMLASSVLRAYLGYVARNGISYGALATPIGFLLFAFFLGFAVILGAEFNATVQEFWPAKATRIDQMREWLATQENPAVALATGPIRIARAVVRRDDDRPTEPIGRPASDTSSRAPEGDQSPLRNPS